MKKNCDECSLIFRRLGSLSIEDRLQRHKKQLHQIKCQRCPRRFVSMAHLQLHLESYHMTSCGNCLRFCGSQCTIYIAEHCELKSKRMLDNGILQKIKATEAAKESLEICIRDRVDLSSSLSQDMGRLMDLGFEGPRLCPGADCFINQHQNIQQETSAPRLESGST